MAGTWLTGCDGRMAGTWLTGCDGRMAGTGSHNIGCGHGGRQVANWVICYGTRCSFLYCN